MVLIHASSLLYTVVSVSFVAGKAADQASEPVPSLPPESGLHILSLVSQYFIQ